MNDKKKKKKSPFWTIAVLIYIVLSLVADGDGLDAPVLIVGLSIAAVIVGLISYVSKKNAAEKQEAEEKTWAERSAPQPRPAVQRSSPEISEESARAPRKKEALIPDNGDKYIAQLNGFLKNGIIERSEYNYLLQKYRSNKNNRLR